MDVRRCVRLHRHDADGAELVAALELVALFDPDLAQAGVADDDVVDAHLNGLAEHPVLVHLGDLAAQHRENVVAELAVKVDAGVRLPNVERLEVDAVLAVGAQDMPRFGGHAQTDVGGKHGFERVGSPLCCLGRGRFGRLGLRLRVGRRFGDVLFVVADKIRAERGRRNRHLGGTLLKDRNAGFVGGNGRDLAGAAHGAVC